MKNKKVELYIDIEKCKGCLMCIDACPAGSLKVSEKINKKGHQYVFMRDEDKCTGCGLCFMMCPDCAIEIRTCKAPSGD